MFMILNVVVMESVMQTAVCANVKRTTMVSLLLLLLMIIVHVVDNK